MNWNNNDTKYIIKRFIIYILIAFAMFIIGTWKADARTFYTEEIPGQQNGMLGMDMASNVYELGFNFQTPMFNNQGLGDGYILFNMYEQVDNSQRYTNFITEVIAIGKDNAPYVCELDTITAWIDNPKQTNYRQVKCHMNMNQGLKRILFHRAVTTTAPTTIILGGYITFVGDSNTAVNVNVNQQQVVNEIAQQGQLTVQAIETETQKVVQQQQQTNQKLDDINNSINNDNITSSDADSFANNGAFSDTTGLESVINLPLNMVNSLSNQCVPIQIHIPYLETDATIPCMSTIYRSKFNSLYTLVKLVVNGFLVYRILLKVYELVHEAKQPDEDKLEVIEL